MSLNILHWSFSTISALCYCISFSMLESLSSKVFIFKSMSCRICFSYVSSRLSIRSTSSTHYEDIIITLPIIKHHLHVFEFMLESAPLLLVEYINHLDSLLYFKFLYALKVCGSTHESGEFMQYSNLILV
jgi:hypothetical protein